MGISVTLKYFRLLLFRCKIFFRKHFFYFPVFSTTENRDQTKSIFWLTKKTLFNFRKIISPIYYYFLKKKTVNLFSSLSFSFLHALSLVVHFLSPSEVARVADFSYEPNAEKCFQLKSFS
jgi:hypothetical protein